MGPPEGAATGWGGGDGGGSSGVDAVKCTCTPSFGHEYHRE